MSNIKSGRWIGFKKVIRRRTPKTGATESLLQWAKGQRGAWLKDAACAAMPQYTRPQMQHALTNLVRRGLVRETGGWISRSKVWELV